jgi:hypothetical protein
MEFLLGMACMYLAIGITYAAHDFDLRGKEGMRIPELGWWFEARMFLDNAVRWPRDLFIDLDVGDGE